MTLRHYCLIKLITLRLNSLCASTWAKSYKQQQQTPQLPRYFDRQALLRQMCKSRMYLNIERRFHNNVFHGKNKKQKKTKKQATYLLPTAAPVNKLEMQTSTRHPEIAFIPQSLQSHTC